MGSLRSFYGFCGILILLCSYNFAAAEDSDDDDLDDGVVAEEIDLDDLGSVNYTSPSADPERYHFSEHFDDIKNFKKKWVLSQAKKDGADESIAKYDGEWEVEAPVRKILLNDLGLVLKSKAKHAAISARLEKPFVFNKNPLVVQYEVTLQEGQQCGGAYIKLLSTGAGTRNLKEFYDKTPYTIMFGPDKCGNDHKLHFIFRHKNPLNGTIEEKHCKKAKSRLDSFFSDSRPHLYTLILKPNNDFQIFVDNKEVNSGSLLGDFTPSVNPPETIDDPEDRKPLDWDERESIPDPNDSKPIDWDEKAPEEIVDSNALKPDGWLDDEPLTIPDSAAVRPKDWDDEMDGEWEAPLIDNPKCVNAPGCGKWSAPLIANPAYKGVWRPQLISNPNYKGKWRPRTINNPDYFKDDFPFRMASIDAVGIELWSMSPNILFDNIVITDDPIAAAEWALKTFSVKMSKLTKNEESVVDWVLNVTNEHPWLWAVYIILIAFISGLTLYLCCFRNSEGKDSSDAATKDENTKKTDAVTEDSPSTPPEEIPNEAAEVKKQSEEEEIEIEETFADRPSKQDLEEPVSDETDEAEIAPELVGSGDAPRKRKPRKE